MQTIDEALARLDRLDVEFALVRNKYSYGETKRGWTCTVHAKAMRKGVESIGFGETAADAAIEAINDFFDVQENGLKLAVIKTPEKAQLA